MQLSCAVLLAGGAGKTLHPLTSAGTPKALLSAGNQALISFPLLTLEQGGVTHTIVVSRATAHLLHSKKHQMCRATGVHDSLVHLSKHV